MARYEPVGGRARRRPLRRLPARRATTAGSSSPCRPVRRALEERETLTGPARGSLAERDERSRVRDRLRRPGARPELALRHRSSTTGPCDRAEGSTMAKSVTTDGQESRRPSARARRAEPSERGQAPGKPARVESLVQHGAADLPSVIVDSYNLELRDKEGFIGDRASQARLRRQARGLARQAAQDRRGSARRRRDRGHLQEAARRRSCRAATPRRRR